MKVCLDSRLIKKGDYFVPVVGEEFDGHKFVESALKNGAEGIIEEKELYDIASKKLAKINPVVIAITGSVGKTSMRDYITTLLSTQFRVCKGSLNTKLGLAVNIVNDMQNDCEFFVAECGMDRVGELTETGMFIKPNIVVLTNISESHAEKVGTLEDIKKAKSELLKTMNKKGTVFVNEKSKAALDVAKKYAPSKIVDYGDWENTIQLNVIGDANLINAHGAWSVAKSLGVKNLESKVLKLTSSKGRLNKLEGVNDCVIFDDTYNSSPVSCEYSLKAVSKFPNSGRKIAILGGMLELGQYEKAGHEKIGDLLANLEYTYVILVGDLAKKFITKKLKNSPTKIIEIEDSEKAAYYALNELNPKEGDVFLVKGSQGIRMEKCVKILLKDPKKAKYLLVRQDLRWL